MFCFLHVPFQAFPPIVKTISNIALAILYIAVFHPSSPARRQSSSKRLCFPSFPIKRSGTLAWFHCIDIISLRTLMSFLSEVVFRSSARWTKSRAIIFSAGKKHFPLTTFLKLCSPSSRWAGSRLDIHIWRREEKGGPPNSGTKLTCFSPRQFLFIGAK